MAALLPLPLRNLPRPVTMDIGLDLTIVDTDGDHTSAPSDLANLMKRSGNPVYAVPVGGWVGFITQASIDNFAKLNPHLPPPIRPEDTDKAILTQCSRGGLWLPDTKIICGQLAPNWTRKDHPILNVMPWGSRTVLPTTAACRVGQIAVRSNSGSPWPYMQLLTFGLQAMDRKYRLAWKAAGTFWTNAIDILLMPFLKAEGIGEDLGWWDPLSGAKFLRIQTAVILHANQYSE
jgi:hypothetical protein